MPDGSKARADVIITCRAMLEIWANIEKLRIYLFSGCAIKSLDELPALSERWRLGRRVVLLIIDR